MQRKPANSSDYPRIAICFRDTEISYLFAELIEAEGYQTEIITDAETIASNTHIVTESSLLDLLPKDLANSCLVIGDSSTKVPKNAVPLIRPLSEDKIDLAFSKFLPKR